MNTRRRLDIYGPVYKMTARQRRRTIKKAGTDPNALVIRDDGMGYSLARQGFRELVEVRQDGQ